MLFRLVEALLQVIHLLTQLCNPFRCRAGGSCPERVIVNFEANYSYAAERKHKQCRAKGLKRNTTRRGLGGGCEYLAVKIDSRHGNFSSFLDSVFCEANHQAMH